MSQNQRSLVDTNVKNSLATVFSFSLAEYEETLKMDSDALIKGGREIIDKYKDELHTRSSRCYLDWLLEHLLREAPTPEGQQHVGAVLHIADKKGQEGVIRVAEAWLSYLIYPMSGTLRPYPRSDGEDRERKELENDLKITLAIREHDHCAVTNFLDRDVHVRELEANPGLKPKKGARILKAAHIIRFSPNKLPVETREGLKISPREREAILSWDVLRAWSGYALSEFAGHDVNSPENAVLLTSTELQYFREGEFKAAYPYDRNKYQARMIHPIMIFTNNKPTADVEFSDDEGVEPPNETLLQIHASIAKVIKLPSWIWNMSHLLET